MRCADCRSPDHDRRTCPLRPGRKRTAKDAVLATSKRLGWVSLDELELHTGLQRSTLYRAARGLVARGQLDKRFGRQPRRSGPDHVEYCWR
tara:strand:+ start:5923 stop:6195 length:273 start_codon:yes stop_codon:yes gene_type:complete